MPKHWLQKVPGLCPGNSTEKHIYQVTFCQGCLELSYVTDGRGTALGLKDVVSSWRAGRRWPWVFGGWKGCQVMGVWKTTWSPQSHTKPKVSVLFAVATCPLLCHIIPWPISCPWSSSLRGYLSFWYTLANHTRAPWPVSVKMSWDSLHHLNHKLINSYKLNWES